MVQHETQPSHWLTNQIHRLGLIAYAGEKPVGWVAVAPRVEYPHLNQTRDTAPLGDITRIWVVPCFFVVEANRGQGVATILLNAAVEFAKEHGATAIEGVPGDPDTRTRSPSASYTGSTALFQAMGFQEFCRRTPKGRVVMRRTWS